MDYEVERKRILEEHRDGRKRRTWLDLGNTLFVAAVAAALAWWAYGTVAHAILFAFVMYGIDGIGNRIVYELGMTRLRMETRELSWRQDERLDRDIDDGRIVRRDAI